MVKQDHKHKVTQKKHTLKTVLQLLLSTKLDTKVIFEPAGYTAGFFMPELIQANTLGDVW